MFTKKGKCFLKSQMIEGGKSGILSALEIIKDDYDNGSSVPGSGRHPGSAQRNCSYCKYQPFWSWCTHRTPFVTHWIPIVSRPVWLQPHWVMTGDVSFLNSLLHFPTCNVFQSPCANVFLYTADCINLWVYFSLSLINVT